MKMSKSQIIEELAPEKESVDKIFNEFYYKKVEEVISAFYNHYPNPVYKRKYNLYKTIDVDVSNWDSIDYEINPEFIEKGSKTRNNGTSVYGDEKGDLYVVHQTLFEGIHGNTRYVPNVMNPSPKRLLDLRENKIQQEYDSEVKPKVLEIIENGMKRVFNKMLKDLGYFIP